MRWIALCLGLTGCSLVHVDEGPRAGSAHVTIPRMAAGQPAVFVFAVSRHRLVAQELDYDTYRKASSLTLRPGRYVLELECQRPGASVVLHGGFEFAVAVEAGTAYTLDCSPVGDTADNRFSLVRTTH
jgi:hypothetical protein